MLKVFNSLQITGLFAISPFIINWLFTSATFPGATIVAWISVIIYLIFFGVMTGCVLTAIED